MAIHAKVRIRVIGFIGLGVWGLIELSGIPWQPGPQHLVERERQEREVERPAKRFGDAADDPGEQDHEGEPTGEAAKGHERITLPATRTTAAPIMA